MGRCEILRIRSGLKSVRMSSLIHGWPRVTTVGRVRRHGRVRRGACAVAPNGAWRREEIANTGQTAWRLRCLRGRYRGVGIFLCWGRWREFKSGQTGCIRSTSHETWRATHRIRPRVHMGRGSDCGSHGDGVFEVLGQLAEMLRLSFLTRRTGHAPLELPSGFLEEARPGEWCGRNGPRFGRL